MCFSLQRRAIFRHLNFQKCSKTVSFLASLLENVLRASGVQFFLSALSSYLRTHGFSEPTFRPSRHTNHWKNTAFRDFPNISRNCIFFLLTLLLCSACHLLTLLPCSAFQLSILSEVPLLHFLWQQWASLKSHSLFQPLAGFGSYISNSIGLLWIPSSVGLNEG